MIEKVLPWGEEIWENKINKQNEEGVIFGIGYSKTQIKRQTDFAMNMFFKDLLPLIKTHGKILDVGIGPMARFSIEFAKLGFKVTGLDISKTTLKFAQKYISKAKVPAVKLIKADMSDYIGNSKYNLIFCVETFYHIPAHLGFLTLRNFNNMLNRNDYILVGFNILEGRKISASLYKLYYQLIYKFAKHIFKKKAQPPCITEYKEEELNDMLKITGFKVEKKLNYNKYWLNNLWVAKKN